VIELPSWQCYPLPNHNSPFDRGRSERPLGITIHMPGYGSDQAEADALAVLREIVQLDSIAFADSAADSPRRIEVDPADRNLPGGASPITIQGPEGAVLHTGIGHPRQWDDAVSRVLQECPIARDEATRDVFIAAVHQALHHDLFITDAPALLRLRGWGWLDHHTICRPSEALKIAGLYLRCRDDYSVSGPPHARVMIDRSTMYLAATRDKAPRLWRRPGAWREIWRTHPAIARLHATVISRCRRALMARDAIGSQFYRSSQHRSEEVASYHFDYLTLLLSGAIDASARIIRRLYDLRITDQNTSLWRRSFARELLRGGHDTILAIATSDDSADLRTLLAGLRNTIHGEALRTISFSRTRGSQLLLIQVEENAQALWNATQRFGGPDAWGLMRLGGTQFEPFTYATRLVETCFDLLGRLGEATDAEGQLAPTANIDSTNPDWISAPVLARCGLLV
jgi:hypothetical protein